MLSKCSSHCTVQFKQNVSMDQPDGKGSWNWLFGSLGSALLCSLSLLISSATIIVQLQILIFVSKRDISQSWADVYEVLIAGITDIMAPLNQRFNIIFDPTLFLFLSFSPSDESQYRAPE